MTALFCSSFALASEGGKSIASDLDLVAEFPKHDQPKAFKV
jgi:hypothetical protein